jgi:hypothetical protein
MIQLVNTISLCGIIFCSILFVVLTEMCYIRFDHPAIYHTIRLLVNVWRASTLGHDLKRSLMDPSLRYGKTFKIIFWSISRWKTGLSSRKIFGLSRAVCGHIDVEAWRSLHWENGCLAKTKMMNCSDSNPWAKSRSWGEVKWKGTFGSPAACIPFLVWLGQEWLFDQKKAFSQESSS